MKIGILTFHYPENMNYGAMLQTYATYNILNKLGFEPYVINYIKDPIIQISYTGIKVEPHFIQHYLRLFLGITPFRKFSNDFMPNKTDRFKFDELYKLNNEFSAFIVGSDQVWRYVYNRNNISSFFLDFVDDHKIKLSYAASFGIDVWNEIPDSETAKIGLLLKKFKAISVREKSGIDICKNVFDVNAVQTLDPTLLLSQSDLDLIIDKSLSEKIIRNKGYIASMFINTSADKLRLLNTYKRKRNIKIIDIGGKNLKLGRSYYKKYNSISKWLTYLKYSDLVVTDSFHCVIFSIIFKKQFICVADDESKVSRLENLLSLFHISGRLFTTLEEALNSDIWNTEIDYSLVDKYLDDNRQVSIEFLTRNLKVRS